MNSIKGAKEKVLEDHGEARITAAILKYYFHASSEYRALSDEKVAAEALKRKRASRRSDRTKKVSRASDELFSYRAHRTTAVDQFTFTPFRFVTTSGVPRGGYVARGGPLASRSS